MCFLLQAKYLKTKYIFHIKSVKSKCITCNIKFSINEFSSALKLSFQIIILRCLKIVETNKTLIKSFNCIFKNYLCNF